jgi:hypothetical protein
MNNSSEKKEEGISKANLLRLILIITEFVILLVLLFAYITSGINPIILVLIMIFVILFTIGLTFIKRKKSMYSQMFPDRKRQSSQSSQIRKIRKKKVRRIIYQDKEEGDEEKEELDEIQPIIYKSISLDIKRNKPVIIKCENCGMIVAGFVKECPKCKEKIYY